MTTNCQKGTFGADAHAPPPAQPGYEVLVALDGGGGLSVNGGVQGTVIAQRAGGGTAMSDGQVVLYGKNASGNAIQNELPNGSRVEIEAAIPGIGADAWGAVGGGPMIVQGGVPVAARRGLPLHFVGRSSLPDDRRGDCRGDPRGRPGRREINSPTNERVIFVGSP